MPVTLGTVKTEVSSRIGRGTALDSAIPAWIKKAIRATERKSNFNYMYKEFTGTLDASATYPRTIQLDSTVIKAIDFVRLLPDSTKDYFYLTREVDGRRFAPPQTEMPTHYRLVEARKLFLNNTPDKDYPFEIAWFEYSDPATSDGTEHWLFDNFQDGIEELTMAYACTRTRDFDRAGQHLALWQLELDQLLQGEEELQLLNADLAMQYDPFQ